jgi:hypothetical protein
MWKTAAGFSLSTVLASYRKKAVNSIRTGLTTIWYHSESLVFAALAVVQRCRR